MVCDTRRIFQTFLAALPFVLGACSGEAASAPQKPEPKPARTIDGDQFPAGIYRDLMATGGLSSVDLSEVLGKKPVIFVYWIAGNERSEKVFQSIQAIVEESGPDKIALYGVVKPSPGREADVILARATALGIRVPILDDGDLSFIKTLQVRSVPSVTLIDAEGRLRLANGASLVQVLEYNLTLEGAIRRAAQTGKVGSYGFLARYYPVQELVGKAGPDFSAKLLDSDEPRQWSKMQAKDKLNVLVFWSVDCGHCRESLPKINEWLKSHSAGVNVVSAAMVDDSATRKKTLEFCEANGFVFPTLVDERHIADQYFVTSTPTIVILGPNGVIDSVVLSDETDIGKAIEERRRALLPSQGS